MSDIDSTRNQERAETAVLPTNYYTTSDCESTLPEDQSYTMLQVNKPKEVRTYTAQDWDAQRPEIARLYEKNTLESVIKFMREQHGLDATPKRYRDRIKKWGLNKHIQSNEMEAMIRKQRERMSEGKEKTAIRIRGQPVNPQKLSRYVRDHQMQPLDIKADKNRELDMTPTATPAAISCYTPSDTEVLTPQGASSPYEMSDPEPLLSQHLNGSGNDGHSVPANLLQYGTLDKSILTASSNGIENTLHTPIIPSQDTYSYSQYATQSYAFQSPNYTGRRRALLVGINYVGQRCQLRGSINDVKNMSIFLVQNYGYVREQMVVLTDNQQNPTSRPTKQNILRAMHWLVRDARPNDSLFFHYSGHGGQVRDQDGDEEDGYDEVIYPVDFRQVGHIVDNEMHDIIVKPLLPGVRLTAIFDSCYSGTALNIPYIYSTQGILKEPNVAKEAGNSLLGVISSCRQGNLSGVASNVLSFIKKISADANHSSSPEKEPPAKVIMWSGRRDDQKSAISEIGAVSAALIASIEKNPRQSYMQLLNSIRDRLEDRYIVRPQISSNHPLSKSSLPAKTRENSVRHRH